MKRVYQMSQMKITAISIKGRKRELKIDVIRLETSRNSSFAFNSLCLIFYLNDGNKKIVFRNVIEI